MRFIKTLCSFVLMQALSTSAVAIDVAHDGSVVSQSHDEADEVADLKRQVQELRDIEAARESEHSDGVSYLRRQEQDQNSNS